MKLGKQNDAYYWAKNIVSLDMADYPKKVCVGQTFYTLRDILLNIFELKNLLIVKCYRLRPKLPIEYILGIVIWMTGTETDCKRYCFIHF